MPTILNLPADGETNWGAKERGNLTALQATADANTAAIGFTVPVPTGTEGTDTANILAAVASAEAVPGGRVLFQSGDYHTNGTIVFKNCDVDAPMGSRIIANTGSNAAVQLGTPTVNLTAHTLRLPQLLKISNAYGVGTGLQLTWANANEIHIPYIYRFGTGVFLNGDGLNGGYVYSNTFHIGMITSDVVNIKFNKVNAGFSTQCTFIGGILNFGVTGTRVVGTRQLVIGDTTTQEIVGQHSFFGCDLESSVAEYLIDCYDSGNHWFNCRWESATAGYIRWLDDGVGTIYARNNVIHGGWQAELLNVTSGTYAKNNHILIPGSKTGKKQRLAAPAPRTVTDGVTTSASTTVTSATAAFTDGDVTAGIAATGIPAATTIVSVTNATTCVISAPATATATAVSITITPVADRSLTQTVATAVDTALDITLNGIAPGQVIEVSTVGHWNTGAPYVFMDAATIVAGAPVNYVSNPNGFTTTWGNLGWAAVGGVETFFGANQLYTVVPGDLAAGGVLTLRLMYRLNSAGTRVLAANGNVPLTFHARVCD